MTEGVLRFAAPEALLLAPLIAAPWLWLLWGRRRNRRMRAASAALESLALALLIAALARPEVRTFDAAAGTLLWFEDVSASQRGAAPTAPPALSRPVRVWGFAEGLAAGAEPVSPDATRLAPVLSMVLAEDAPAAVIVTDGRFTDAESAEGLARRVRDSGAAVWLVPRAPTGSDVRLAELSARRDRRGRAALTVTVAANAPAECELTLRRADLERPLLVQTLRFEGPGPRTVRLSDEPGPDRAAYVAELRAPGDLLAENNRMEAFASPVERVVALVGLDADEPLLGADGPWRLERMAPAELSDDPARLARFAAIVLADPTGRALTAAQRSALAGHVRLGGGLLLLGLGPHGQSGDEDDPLNAVAALLPRERARRPLDVTILLDASGSMNQPYRPPGRPNSSPRRRFDLARDSALAVARRRLGDRDVLRVFTFKGRATSRYAGPAGAERFDDLAAALAEVEPGGATLLAPALRAAVEVESPPELARLIIVLTDLQTEPFDADAWARRIAEAEATLAVAATGVEDPDRPRPLRRLADQLAGPMAVNPDLGSLAEIFGEFIGQARGSLLTPEPATLTPVGPATPWGAPDDWPPLDTYLLARVAEGAELLAVGPDDQPLLARAVRGAGRAVSLAAPMNGPYNRLWRRSDAGRALLAEALAWSAAGAGDPRFVGRVERGDGSLTVTLEAEAPVEPASPAPTAHWRGLAGPAVSAPMRQVSPSRFVAELPAPARSAGSVAATDAEGALLWRTVLPGRYKQEYAAVGEAPESLARWARRLGGSVVEADALAAELRQWERARWRPLWPMALAAALAAMLVEWLTAWVIRRAD